MYVLSKNYIVVILYFHTIKHIPCKQRNHKNFENIKLVENYLFAKVLDKCDNTFSQAWNKLVQRIKEHHKKTKIRFQSKFKVVFR